MAIVVEEGKKNTNILGMAGWIAFLGVLAAAIYYIFFTEPQLVPVTASDTLSEIAPLAQETDPSALLNSAQFQSLQSTVTPLPSPTGPASVGRTDPFIPPQ